MRSLEQRAAGLGFRVVALGVENHDARAVRLCQSLGYLEFKREEGRTPDEQLLLMKKTLHAASPECRGG